jgi:hypothetical protein
VDNFWPDIEDHILWEFRLSMNQPVLEESPKKPYSCLCLPFGRFRDCFRYNYDPVDRRIWGQFKNVWYWLILLISSFPFYAVQPFFKLFVWLMIDKSDEFQLVQFILNFKTLQFFTLGCIGSIAGFVGYFGCISFSFDGDERRGDQINECAVKGPKDNYVYVLEVSEFFWIYKGIFGFFGALRGFLIFF